jgi:hypothetical protein
VNAPALMAQEIDILSFIAFTIFLVVQERRWTARAGWALPHTTALLSGTLAFGILFSLLFGWSVLEPVATLPFLGLLVVLAIRVQKVKQSAD